MGPRLHAQEHGADAARVTRTPILTGLPFGHAAHRDAAGARAGGARGAGTRRASSAGADGRPGRRSNQLAGFMFKGRCR